MTLQELVELDERSMPDNAITLLDLAIIIDTLIGCTGIADAGYLFKYNPETRQKTLNKLLHLAHSEQYSLTKKEEENA